MKLVLKTTFIIIFFISTVSSIILTDKKNIFAKETADYNEGEIIVKFKDTTSKVKAAGVLEKHGMEKKVSVQESKIEDKIKTTKIKVPKGKNAEEAAEELKRDPAVEYAEPDYILKVDTTPDDTSYNLLWGLPAINADDAWASTTGSTSVTVAVLDTGVKVNHSDLSNNIVSGYNTINNSTTVTDVHGHGTHVAGTIGAVYNNSTGVTGVAGTSKIMPVKVLGDDGSGFNSDIIEGIIWAADNGADVINMSLGGYSTSQALQDAVDYAYDAGVVIIAASGNDNTSNLAYPASCDNVISVAAVDQNLAKASFSNYGTAVDIAAPGTSIYSTTNDGSYGYKQGTSMASPHVAGVAALIISANSSYSPADVMLSLTSNAQDLGTSGRDNIFGYGLVDADASLSGVTPVISGAAASPTSLIANGTNLVTISYTLSASMTANVKIYDSSNALVDTVVNGSQSMGLNSVTWDGKDSNDDFVSNGTYTYKINGTNTYSQTATEVTGTFDVISAATGISGVSISDSSYEPDGSNEVTISYTLETEAYVTVSIYSGTKLVKYLYRNELKSSGSNSAVWNGIKSGSEFVPDGTYTYKILVKNSAGLTSTPIEGNFVVDSRTPELSKINFGKEIFGATGVSTMRIKYAISEDSTVSLKVYNSGDTLVSTIIDDESITKGSKTVYWDGKNDSDVLLPNGVYTYKLNATDSLSNTATEEIGTVNLYSTGTAITGNSLSSATFQPTGSNAVTLTYTLDSITKVKVTIYEGTRKKVTLLNNVEQAAGVNTVTWDGSLKNNGGTMIDDGDYTYKIEAKNLARFVSTPVEGNITVDSRSPSFTRTKFAKNVFGADGTATYKINYTLSEDADVTIKVYNASNTLVATPVNAVSKEKGRQEYEWNGKNDSDALLGNGVYTIKVTAEDGLGKTSADATNDINYYSSATAISGDSVDDSTFEPTGSNVVTLTYTLDSAAKVKINIYEGTRKKVTLVNNEEKLTGTHTVTWDGSLKNNGGTMIDDGDYTYKIEAASLARIVSTPVEGNITVDSRSPSFTSSKFGKNIFYADGTEVYKIGYTLSEDADVTIKVYNASNTLVATPVNAVSKTKGKQEFEWNGKNDLNAFLSNGIYTIKVNAVDDFSNAATEITNEINYYKEATNISGDSVDDSTFEPTGSNEVTLTYALDSAAKIKIDIYEGTRKKVSLVNNEIKQPGTHTVTWDGAIKGTTMIDDGDYTYKIEASNLARIISTPSEGNITVDSRNPSFTSSKFGKNIFYADGTEVYKIGYTLSEDADVTIKVYNASNTLVATPVDAVSQTKGKQEYEWNGKNDSNAFLSNGIYTIKVSAVDDFSNAATEITNEINYYKEATNISGDSVDAPTFEPTGSNELTLTYTLDSAAKIKIDIYEGTRKKVSLVNNEIKQPGTHTVTWDGAIKGTTMIDDDTYTYKIEATNLARIVSTPSEGSIKVDSRSPSFTKVNLGKDVFKADGTLLHNIKYTLSEDATVTIKVYDSEDTLVHTIVNEVQEKGKKVIEWNGEDGSDALLDNGVYTIKINATDSLSKTATEITTEMKYYKEATNFSAVSITDPFTPNGSNSSTLAYSTDSEATIKIKILDSDGRTVKTLDSGTLKVGGDYTATWDGTNGSNDIVTAGTYTYKIEAKNLARLITTPVTGTFTVS